MDIFLDSYGTKLKVKNGLFEISYFDGSDRLKKIQHAPAEVESIWMSNHAMISTFAMELAINNGIDVVLTDKYGHPKARLNPIRPNSTSLIQKSQAYISINPMALKYVKAWVLIKLHNQIQFLTKLKSYRSKEKKKLLSQQIEKIRKLRAEVDAIEDQPLPQVANKIRGLEGVSARVFFTSLSELLPERYRFHKRTRRPAKDPFNAFLNYSYAILYNWVEVALVKAGLNPYLGFLHRDEYHFKSMVYDFVEPYRIIMVRIVFRLFSGKKINVVKHVAKAGGGIVLTASGKKLLLSKINATFLRKKIPYGELNLKQDQILLRDARKFAQSLIRDMKNIEKTLVPEQEKEMEYPELV